MIIISGPQEINRDIRKLAWTLTIIKKIKNYPHSHHESSNNLDYTNNQLFIVLINHQQMLRFYACFVINFFFVKRLIISFGDKVVAKTVHAHINGL
jgi:hypothetical protein